MSNGTSARYVESESAIRTKTGAMTTCWTDQESRTANIVLLHHDGCTEGIDISRLKSPCEITIYRAAFGYEASAGKTIARGVHALVRRRLSPGEESVVTSRAPA